MSATRPRRRKRSTVARMRPVWILAVLVAGALGFGLYRAARWPGFRPSTVVVRGNAIVPTGEILARAGVSTRRNLWLQNGAAIAARVAAIPDIGRVTIERRLPNRITIAVTERQPYALVVAGGRSAVIDTDLRVLGPASADGLPVWHLATLPAPLVPGRYLQSAPMSELHTDDDLLRAAGVPIQSLAFDRYGELIARSGGVRLLLGDDADLAKKAALIAPILAQAAHGRRIAALDLRAPDAPVVTYR